MSTTLDNQSDGQLIRRFVQERDERAFAKLVERHGALVAGVCARLLRNRADAEDAFQAVFMVLSRRANAVRRQASLAAWLHGVAVRVCLNERKIDRRRQQRLQEAAEVVRKSNCTVRSEDLKRVLDEELAALPQRVREVLVLCDLEGRTREEVASTLSLPTSTVSSRLKRGRELMRKRLARHGLTIAVGGLAAALAECSLAAPIVSAELVHLTVANADAFRWGSAAARATLSHNIVSLAEGVLHAMILAQWKTAVCLVAILTISMLGGALWPGSVPAMIQTASATPILLEDFNDGDLTDDTLHTWRLFEEGGFANGTIDASTGDLVLTPNSENDTLIATLEPPINVTNLSIRTRIRNRGLESAASHGTGVLVNGNRADSAIDFGIETDGSVYLLAHPGALVLGSEVQTDLRPSVEDVVLQLDLFDGAIRGFAWRAGEPMPSSPTISGSSPLPPGGDFSVYINPPSEDSSATFRYVYVGTRLASQTGLSGQGRGAA